MFKDYLSWINQPDWIPKRASHDKNELWIATSKLGWFYYENCPPFLDVSRCCSWIGLCDCTCNGGRNWLTGQFLRLHLIATYSSLLSTTFHGWCNNFSASDALLPDYYQMEAPGGRPTIGLSLIDWVSRGSFLNHEDNVTDFVKNVVTFYG